jgi:RHS repeat-associated protein
VAPVSVIFFNQDEGGPGPSHLATGDYNYDSRSMLMTTAAICATREVSWWPSYYRGEQYDQDLGLYYLRARYYNPATGRFLSRDPLDGNALDPKTLHKYLYAGGDPVNAMDPTGRNDLVDLATIVVVGAYVAAKIDCIVYAVEYAALLTVIHLFPGSGATNLPPLPWWQTVACTVLGLAPWWPF